MSVVFLVVPLVVGGWPILSAAIIAATASLGYSAASAADLALADRRQEGAADATERSVEMRMTDAQVVEETLMRGESLTFRHGDVTATFGVDGRGACTVHVGGVGKTNAELNAIGETLMDRVRQQFAYAKVMEELDTRGFSVVDQRMEQDQSIRIRVKR